MTIHHSSMGKKRVITLTDYQKRWMADHARYKIGMLARQTGKTFMGCLEIVRDCLHAEAKGERITWYIVSRSARQSLHVLDTIIKPLIQATNAMMFHLSEENVATRQRGASLFFPHGSKIVALPADPDTLRGITGHILLDEFAFHHDSHRLWASVFPVASRCGLKIRVLSTPNGRDNMFYQLMTKAQGWSRHAVPIDQAIKEGLPRDQERLKEACGDAALWRQEYLLDWNSVEEAWLPPESLNKCIVSQVPLLGNSIFTIGNDIAIRRDRWATVVLENRDHHFAIRHFETLKGICFHQQDQLLKDLIERYHPVRVVMDQTGIGERSVEEMKALYGSLIEGCVFTSSRRLKMAVELRTLVEQGRIAIPDDDCLLEDFRSVLKIGSSSGHVRPFVRRGSHGHGDLFWACAMACDALSRDIPVYAYDSLVPQ